MNCFNRFFPSPGGLIFLALLFLLGSDSLSPAQSAGFEAFGYLATPSTAATDSPSFQSALPPVASDPPLPNARSSDSFSGYGWTPLHEAVARNDLQEVRDLLARKVQVDAKDLFGVTPLFVLETGSIFTQRTYGKYFSDGDVSSIREALLAAGADPNPVDVFGKTPEDIRKYRQKTMDLHEGHKNKLGMPDRYFYSIVLAVAFFAGLVLEIAFRGKTRS